MYPKKMQSSTAVVLSK